jgi:hypothetical protein
MPHGASSREEAVREAVRNPNLLRDGEQLRPSEVQWIEEALPQLFIEWCEDPLQWAG